METDDIRDICMRVEEFNLHNTLDVEDILIIMDINSMYDAISFADVRDAFQFAASILPVGYLTDELCNLFERAVQIIEHNTYILRS